MAKQQFTEKELIWYLSKLKPNEHVRFKVVEGDISKFKFRINSIDTRDVYAFSYFYHDLVSPKFLLEQDKKYYIYYADQITFNGYSEKEQKDYLKRMYAFGQCIGEISEATDRNLILSNCFHFDTYDTYVVEENSSKYKERFGNWLRPLKEADSVKASVQIKSILEEASSGRLIIEVETDDEIPIDPYIRFIDTLVTAIDESNMFQCRRNRSGGKYDTYTIAVFCVKYRLNLLKITFDLTSTGGSYRGDDPHYMPKNKIEISPKFKEEHTDQRGVLTFTDFESDVQKAIVKLRDFLEALKERCKEPEDKIICDELIDIINNC